MPQRIIGLTIILASFVFAWLMMDFNNFIDTPLGIPTDGEVYELRPGSTVSTLANDLHEMGYLDKPFYLRLLARWDGSAKKIKAGEYQFSPGMNPRDLLNLLTSGKVMSYSLTLVEGWNFKQVLQAVGQHSALTQTRKDLPPGEIMKELGYPDEHPEGRFLPDTYRFPRGTTDKAFLRRAHEAMRKILEREWPERQEGLPLKTPYEALGFHPAPEKGDETSDGSHGNLCHG